MKTVKVIFENNDEIITGINGTDEEIKEYYKPGNIFNLGMGENDNLQKVKSIEFIKRGTIPNNLKPQTGDRIIIKGIQGAYNNLYLTGKKPVGIVDLLPWNKTIEYTQFYTGYIPFKDKYFSCSGSGQGIKTANLEYLGNYPAKFRKFKDGIFKAGNAEYYFENVNYWLCCYNDLL